MISLKVPCYRVVVKSLSNTTKKFTQGTGLKRIFSIFYQTPRMKTSNFWVKSLLTMESISYSSPEFDSVILSISGRGRRLQRIYSSLKITHLGPLHFFSFQFCFICILFLCFMAVLLLTNFFPFCLFTDNLSPSLTPFLCLSQSFGIFHSFSLSPLAYAIRNLHLFLFSFFFPDVFLFRIMILSPF